MKTGRKPKPLHEKVKSRSVGINDKDYMDILQSYGSLTKAVKTEIINKLKTSKNVGKLQSKMLGNPRSDEQQQIESNPDGTPKEASGRAFIQRKFD